MQKNHMNCYRLFQPGFCTKMYSTPSVSYRKEYGTMLRCLMVPLSWTRIILLAEVADTVRVKESVPYNVPEDSVLFKKRQGVKGKGFELFLCPSSGLKYAARIK